MSNSVLIKRKDLLHMMGTIGMESIPGTELESVPQISPTAVIEDKDNDKKDEIFTEEMAQLLFSLSIIQNCKYCLLIQNPTGFLYEYRNVYFFGESIVIAEKEQRSDLIRFYLVPFIPLAIGAVSSAGIVKAENIVSNYNMVIKEVSPSGEEEYVSYCRQGEEPDEIDRMVRFLVNSHRECLRGVHNG